MFVKYLHELAGAGVTDVPEGGDHRIGLTFEEVVAHISMVHLHSLFF